MDSGRNSELSVGIRIPAKAMLFGEYGVLVGGPALVATLPDPSFEVLGDLSPSRGRGAALEFSSDYFAHPVSFDAEGNVVSPESSSAELFIGRALGALARAAHEDGCDSWMPWVAEGRILKIRVVSSFGSELGLGSSSAILVSLVWLVHWAHEAWARGFSPSASELGFFSLSQAWPQLRACLAAAQGRGSGYDVAVQFTALTELTARSFPGQSPGAAPALWVFHPAAALPRGEDVKKDKDEAAPARGAGLPRVERIVNEAFWGRSGFLLPSGQAAATAQILAAAEGRRREHGFAEEHAKLAAEAVLRVREASRWQDPEAPHPLADLITESLDVARRQGIADHLSVLSALTLLPPDTIYKTMGAGFGDCLWCVPFSKGLPSGSSSHGEWPPGVLALAPRRV